MEAELLGGEVLSLAVEDRIAAAMSARRRHKCHPKSTGFLRVNSAGELGLL